MAALGSRELPSRLLRGQSGLELTAGDWRGQTQVIAHHPVVKKKCLQMASLFATTFINVDLRWTPEPFTKASIQSRKSLQIGQSRRPDSNRGPLHYELSASNLRIRRFPCKCASRRRPPSPYKSTEVHSAPAMCSNGVPINAIRDAGSRGPLSVVRRIEGSKPDAALILEDKIPSSAWSNVRPGSSILESSQTAELGGSRSSRGLAREE
jgi:hypothetical protein